MQQRSSVLSELGWLGLFLAVFAIGVYALNIFVVPHPFNDKIAIVLAGMFAALVLIAARGYAAKRSR